jgi:hypothetical protein
LGVSGYGTERELHSTRCILAKCRPLVYVRVAHVFFSPRHLVSVVQRVTVLRALPRRVRLALLTAALLLVVARRE